MDPRIALRRRHVEATRLQRVGRRIVAGLAIVTAVLMGVWAVNTPMFSVRHIDVVGQTNAVVSTGLNSAGIGLGVPMLLADLGSAEDAIKLDPWVLDVELDRQFPDRLVVKVTERVEVAVLDSGLTVSADGRVMRAHAGQPLTRLHVGAAPENSFLDGAASKALRLVTLLAPIGEVTDVSWGSPGLVAWFAGVEVRFGEAQALETKAAVAALMLPEVRPTEFLDVSVPERPVVRPYELSADPGANSG